MVTSSHFVPSDGWVPRHIKSQKYEALGNDGVINVGVCECCHGKSVKTLLWQSLYTLKTLITPSVPSALYFWLFLSLALFFSDGNRLPAAILHRKYRIPSELRSQAVEGPDSTKLGDYLGSP